MEYLAFADFLDHVKRSFHREQYEVDIHYRSVLFHQYAQSYRYYCRIHHYADEYDLIHYDVLQYEQRLRQYQESSGL